MPSKLQRSDYEDFLIRVYFGREDDPLLACRRRAYLDFNRTLHGARTHKDARCRADKALTRMFVSLRDMHAPTQEQFDEWHRSACLELATIYNDGGYPSFFVGQAQKWLNMTFKYIYVLGDERIPGFGHLYDLCHVPLDKVLIAAMRCYGSISAMCVEPPGRLRYVS